MRWTSICSLAGIQCDSGSDPEVVGVTEDSRKVRPGFVFVAVPGTLVDGHHYADVAVKKGAVAVVGNREGVAEWQGVPYGYCHDPRRAVALVSHEMFGHPARALTLVGVTGTNGKSSVAALTQAILKEAGHKCGNFGTLGYDIGDEVVDAPLTTPNAETLAGLFARARDHLCSHVVMEVSSHALEQDRVAGLVFDIAAMTNLTQDHLDYHQDMGVYRQAKLKLFGLAGRWVVVNADDENESFFREAARVKAICYGIDADEAAVRATGVQLGFDGTRFQMETPWGGGDVRLQLLGRHTVYNALCATAICGALGVEFSLIVRGLEKLPCVPGRFEPVFAGQDFHVVVDYAHTDDALRNTLLSARQMCKKRVIVAFGCGGDRDKGKRPKMGAVAGKFADLVVVTSDNPRTEVPSQIMREVEQGVMRSGLKKDKRYWMVENRREAIAFAIDLAEPGDFVLVAGKGHEDYQIIGLERTHFDDRECAREILEGRKA